MFDIRWITLEFLDAWDTVCLVRICRAALAFLVCGDVLVVVVDVAAAAKANYNNYNHKKTQPYYQFGLRKHLHLLFLIIGRLLSLELGNNNSTKYCTVR